MSTPSKWLEPLIILGRVINIHPEPHRPGSYRIEISTKNAVLAHDLSYFYVRGPNVNDATQRDTNTKTWEPVSLRSFWRIVFLRDFAILPTPELDFGYVHEKFPTLWTKIFAYVDIL